MGLMADLSSTTSTDGRSYEKESSREAEEINTRDAEDATRGVALDERPAERDGRKGIQSRMGRPRRADEAARSDKEVEGDPGL